jgi:hypothetical protein
MSPDGWSDGIVEKEVLAPKALPEFMEKIRTGKRPCSKDRRNRRIKPSVFLSANGNVGIALDTLSHQGAELVLVDREGLARRKTTGIGAPYDSRPQKSELCLEKASCISQRVRAKGIAADKFAKSIGFVDVGLVQRPHFPKLHRQTKASQSQRSFTACQAPPDNSYINAHAAVAG